MKATDSIVKVGKGRGFVIADGWRDGLPPLVVTAAHCVQKMPVAHLDRYLEEQTFPLLGPLFGQPRVWAMVLFYDPIGDVAVLGQPDNQTMSKQADEYEELLADCKPLVIEAAPPAKGSGFVFDLKGKCRPITYTCWNGFPAQPWVHVKGYSFTGGMSGSPVVTGGRALALVAAGSSDDDEYANTPSPSLSAAIPSRLLPSPKERKLAMKHEAMWKAEVARRFPGSTGGRSRS